MKNLIHQIGPEVLEIERISEIIEKKYTLELSDIAKEKITACRAYLNKKTAQKDVLFYGINTGFGSLCNIQISPEDTEMLQRNLVLSHACGTGDEVPAEIVRLMLLLKIQNLSYGYSGVSLDTVEFLIALFNNDVLPVIYQQGSLGASGDLAPLAHLSLPLLGQGKVRINGEVQESAKAVKALKLKEVNLQSKEGLALLNGTQFSTAYALHAILKAKKILNLANLCAAVSVDAFSCRLSPFNHLLHDIRPHEGQRKTAAYLWDTLQHSEIANSDKEWVQDPYAFRCTPQVHGASYDALSYVEKVVMTEINSVTDNPNVFPEADEILSGGNFHAQPIALASDFAAIALSELGSISERRTYQLISGQRGLPAFLVSEPGLNSGMMIPQYTAASIASQNKQYCTPASIDSIVSSNGQEDHVSMAANAGTKLKKVVDNVERILSIEFMTATQALDFRKPLKTAAALEEIKLEYRKIVPFLDTDRLLSDDIHKTISFLQNLS